MITSVKIKDKRKKKSLSQEKLAEMMNVSRQTISNWETGSVVPSVENLKELSKHLDISMAELLGEEPQTVSPENGKSRETAQVSAKIWISGALAVCALLLSVFNLIGIYILNAKFDSQLPENTAIPMEELEGREVDISSWTQAEFEVPEY